MSDIKLPSLPEASVIQNFFKSNIVSDKIKIFEFKLFKYIYNSDLEVFTSLNFKINSTFGQIRDNFLIGLNETEYKYMNLIFGVCDLEVTISTVGMLLLKEVTDPFYLFQVSIKR